MSEIAEAAGVGRATLYRHFESREALIKELTLMCLRETDDRLRPLKESELNGLEAIVAAIDVLGPMADRYRFLMNSTLIAENDPEIQRLYQRQLDELTALVDEAKEANHIRCDLPTAWIVASYDAMLNTAWHLVEQGTLSSKDATAAFKQSFIRSVQSI